MSTAFFQSEFEKQLRNTMLECKRKQRKTLWKTTCLSVKCSCRKMDTEHRVCTTFSQTWKHCFRTFRKTGENTQSHDFWCNAPVGKPLRNAMFSLRLHLQENIWCAGKYTVKTCLPYAGKLGMNSIFYLCSPMVNTEFPTCFRKQENELWTQHFPVINRLVKITRKQGFYCCGESSTREKSNKACQMKSK